MVTPRARCSSNDRYRGSLPFMNDSGPVTAARARLFPKGGQPLQRIVQPAVRRIARIALRHDDEVRIQLVLRIDCRAITHDRLLQRHHLQSSALCAPLALDRLIIDANASGAHKALDWRWCRWS